MRQRMNPMNTIYTVIIGVVVVVVGFFLFKKRETVKKRFLKKNKG